MTTKFPRKRCNTAVFLLILMSLRSCAALAASSQDAYRTIKGGAYTKTRKKWSQKLSSLSPTSRPIPPALRNKQYVVVKTPPADVHQPLPPPALKKTTKSRATTFYKLDICLGFAYLCNAICSTLPILLLPMIAAERTPSSVASSYCATIASIASLGGAVGKFVNGFVCQYMGEAASSSVYLVGLAACIWALQTHSMVGWAVAGMEFCASIQWTACTVVLANHYARDATRFANGITMLSFASTAGVMVSKIIGTALLQRHDWKRVAHFGAIVAMVGAMCMRAVLVQEYPSTILRKQQQQQGVQFKEIGASLKNVVSSRLFWQVGIAHAMAFLARTSDRVLGGFFQDVTNLPGSVCGGLTASVTLGFVHGLVTGNNFHKLKTMAEKTNMLHKRYMYSVMSALGLALCANKMVASILRKPLLALAVALCSGAMASCTSFQFYHLPPTVAKTFGNNKAVCLSFMDGMGFLVAAPIWAITSRIVSHASLKTHGWSVAWTMLAALFAVGGATMMNAIPPVLEAEEKKAVSVFG